MDVALKTLQIVVHIVTVLVTKVLMMRVEALVLVKAEDIADVCENELA